jgi:hypothetical protein
MHYFIPHKSPILDAVKKVHIRSHSYFSKRAKKIVDHKTVRRNKNVDEGKKL